MLQPSESAPACGEGDVRGSDTVSDKGEPILHAVSQQGPMSLAGQAKQPRTVSVAGNLGGGTLTEAAGGGYR